MNQSIKIGNVDLASLTAENEAELFSALKQRIEDRANSESDFVIIRSQGAGVFFGIATAISNGIVVLDKCRRIHYWNGAASLSQMARDGLSDASNRISVRTNDHMIMGVIEIIPCTKSAADKINAIKEWIA